MSDYQAIYDAVRSRIHGSNIAEAVAEVARQAMDFYPIVRDATMAICRVEEAMTRPHALLKPRICIDGNQWCALYGENLMDGVAGFGDSPELACADFDRNWKETLEVSRAKAVAIGGAQ